MIEFTALELVLIIALVFITVMYFRAATHARILGRTMAMILNDPEALDRMRGALTAMHTSKSR